MRSAAALVLCATALAPLPALAGSASSPVVVQVRLVPAQAVAACRALDPAGTVACDVRMANLPAQSAGARFGEAGAAEQDTGDLYWKVGSGVLFGDGAFYSAFTTSRVVNYGGHEFIEMTLSW
ncbi:MAG: hypothetical protein ACXWC2_09750 [Ramlibacter sp.]